MASNIHVAAAYNKGMLDGVVNIKTDANSGHLRIYDGTQPADGDVAIGAQVLLADLTMNATAFTAPSGTASTNQTLTANAITSATASATSTATWFRLLKTDGTTKILDGSVGTSAADMNLNTTAIVSGATVAVSSFTVTLNK
jgi:hypothetical protein